MYYVIYGQPLKGLFAIKSTTPFSFSKIHGRCVFGCTMCCKAYNTYRWCSYNIIAKTNQWSLVQLVVYSNCTSVNCILKWHLQRVKYDLSGVVFRQTLLKSSSNSEPAKTLRMSPWCVRTRLVSRLTEWFWELVAVFSHPLSQKIR